MIGGGDPFYLKISKLGHRTMIILGSLESAYTGLPISVNSTFLLDVTAEALSANIG